MHEPGWGRRSLWARQHSGGIFEVLMSSLKQNYHPVLSSVAFALLLPWHLGSQATAGFRPKTLEFGGLSWTLANKTLMSYEYVLPGESVRAYTRLLTIAVFPPHPPAHIVDRIRRKFVAEPCPARGFHLHEEGRFGMLYSRDYSKCARPSEEFNYSRVYRSAGRTIDISVALRKPISAQEVARLFSDLKALDLQGQRP